MTIAKRSLTALAIASSLALAGCGGSGGPGDPRVSVPQDPTRDQTEQALFCDAPSSRFEVTEFVPADGATGVAVNSNVRITFNANLDANSVNGNV
ncbi:Ig-like domain-containing protein, partial [Marinobacter sp.]|uniref:Ig-like domain-containing protein n=1 Tax=Marinobacter sp. TaxID=50741 RepID=UPI0019ECAEBF